MATPQISQSEITEWENKFREQVSPQVKFTAAEGEPSMKLYNGISGIEATWAGTIILQSDNYIKWTFSIQNEPFVEAKMNVSEDTKLLVEKLYNLYLSWKQEWANVIGGGEPAEDSPEGKQAPAPAPEPMAEGSRTKENIITEHQERMRKLAGLL